MVQAWYIDDATNDPMLEHHLEPPEYLSEEKVTFLTRVELYKINVDNLEKDEIFSTLKKENGYDYDDICEVSRETLKDYDFMLQKFYTEHLHDDDEVRLFLDGSGYFDVRDLFDRWLRIKAEKGDLLILPAGIFHRFTPDVMNYAKVMRLFSGRPVWDAINRYTLKDGVPVDQHPSRSRHLDLLGRNSLNILKEENNY